jgi:hypothetical protein
LLERVRVGSPVFASLRAHVVEVGEREHVAEHRQIRALRVDLRKLRVVFDEDAECVRVFEDVGTVLRRERRVDPGADGADRAERKVEEDPLERRPSEDPERVALADAQ